MLCGPQPHAWPSTRERSSHYFLWRDSLRSTAHLGWSSVLFAMPHAAHVEHHFLLWQDVVLPMPCIFCSSSLPRPWVAQDTSNGTSCLSSGCWVLPLWFLMLGFVGALVASEVWEELCSELVDRSVFRCFLYCNHSWQTVAAWCGFCSET